MEITKEHTRETLGFCTANGKMVRKWKVSMQARAITRKSKIQTFGHDNQ